MQITTRLCSSTSFDRFSDSRTFGQGFKGSGNMAIGVSRSGSVIPSKEFVCFFFPRTIDSLQLHSLAHQNGKTGGGKAFPLASIKIPVLDGMHGAPKASCLRFARLAARYVFD